MKQKIIGKALAVSVILLFISMGVQPAISITKEENSPPYTPTPITPDGSICGLLEWYGGDPDGDNVTYDIHFGYYDPFSNPPKIASIGHYPGNQTHIYYQLEGLLNFETEYEWKIVAWDEYGLNSTSELCLFETEKNFPPNPAKPIYPEDGETNVPVDVIICWNGSDPNKCDIIKYDVYFGLYDPPTQGAMNQTENCYDPYGPDGDLQLFETYYWKVITCDMSGECTSSKTWSFETGINPPPSLELDCPPRWPAGKELCINITSIDPNNDSIMYQIDWDGDLVIDEETDYYPSNETIELCHIYGEKGVYIIRVRGIDEYGEHSNWEECKIEIPRTKAKSYLWFHWFLECFPLLERLLTFLLL